MGSGKKVTVGYKYYLGMHMILCHGPVDKLTRILVDKRAAWSGVSTGGQLSVDADNLFGGESREGGVSGTVDFENGLPSQGQNSYLASQLGPDVPSFRGVAGLVLRQCYLGLNPYLKAWSFRAQRIHTRQNGVAQWYDSKAEIPDLLPGEGPYDSVATRLVNNGGGLDYRWKLDTAFSAPNDTEEHAGTAEDSLPIKREAADSGESPPRHTILGGYGGIVGCTGDDACVSFGTEIETYHGKLTVPYYLDGSEAFTIGVWVQPTIADFHLFGTNCEAAAGVYKGMWLYVDSSGYIHLQFGDGAGAGSSNRLSYISTLAVAAPTQDRTHFVVVTYDPALVGTKFAVFYGGLEVAMTFNGGSAASTAWAAPGSTDPRIGFGVGVESAAPDEFQGLIDEPFLHLGILSDEDIADLYAGGLCAQAAGGSDMNPAHIIRECLTDPDWGMGYLESDVDDASFQTAADVLYAEGFGLSLLWDRQTAIEDFVKEIVRHIQASLYVDRTTGKFKLKLIRADYVKGDLLVLDESCVEEVNNFARPSFGDMVNSVTVNYWDSVTATAASVTAQDTALIQMQGAVVGTTIQYPGCTKQALAAKLATRDLRILSTPLLSCTVYANRKAALLNVGDPFVLDWPDYLAEPTVLRVIGLAFGDGRSNKVKITCIEDAFSFPDVAVVRPEVPDWEDPSGMPSAALYRVVEEAPYYELVQRLGQTTTDEQLAANPDIGYLLGSAAAPSAAINARLAVDAGAGYDGNDTPMDFCPVAFLAAPLTPGETSIAITGGQALSSVLAGTHAQIGNELVKVVSVTDALLTIGRGVLDTVPASHPAGAAVLFWDAYADSDGVEYVSGETVGVKMLPVSGAGQLLLAAAPEDSLTFTSRAIRPYPPGKLLINGSAYPLAIDGEATLALTWAHRDRLQQTAGELQDTSVGNIGPEAGTTYNLRIYGEANTLGRSVIGLSGTSYSYALADERADFELPSDGGGPDTTAFLTHANGSNGSTTFTDVKGHTISVFGNAQISTAEYKFGSSSGLFDGSGDYLTLGATYLGSGDFTVEMWVRFTALGSGDRTLVSQYNTAASARTLLDVRNGKLSIFNGSTGLVSGSTTLSTGVWYHIAFVRQGTVCKGYVDGVLVVTHNNFQTPYNGTSTWFGSYNGSSGGGDFAGYVDDLRISDSALYTANFTPPAAEFPDAISSYRLNGCLRIELESQRGSIISLQKHDYTVLREGYGFNYGKLYGGL